MKAAPVVDTVRQKGTSQGLQIFIREYADGRFGFDWRGEDGRVKVRLQTVEAAVEKARRFLDAGRAR